MSSNVAKPSKRYLELEEERELSRALMKGTKGMQEAEKTFMPKHPAEEEENYKVRLASTTLYGSYRNTLTKMAGKVFSKPVLVNPDVPAGIGEILDNIDGQGRNITSFLFDVMVKGLQDGISFIFVDYTSIKPKEDGTLLTALDVKNMGARSTAILYDASQIIDWKSENIGGVQTLTCIRIKECANEPDPDDEWGEKEVEQIRVLRPGSYELWRKSEKVGGLVDDWYLYDDGVTAISYIPLIPYYTNREGFFEGLPPLQPLAELCKQHWNSSSEQVQALTFARFAMMVFSGVEKGSIGKVGPNVIIELSDSQAKGSRIETAGEGIKAGSDDIKDIEQRMLSAGMTARVETKAGVTATASAIDSTDSDSILMAWATSLEDVANQMLWFMADYDELSDGGTVEINKSFATSKPEGTPKDILDACLAGKISDETFLNEWQRRDILSDSIDVLEELDRINKQAQQLLAMQPQQAVPNPSNVDVSAMVS